MPSLPVYTVRVSKRARRLTLRITRRSGLEVVTPPGVDKRVIEAAVASRREWVARTMARLGGFCEDGRPEACPLPEALELRALGMTVELACVERDGELSLRSMGPDRLLLRGPLGDREDVRRLLAARLRELAKTSFTPRVHELAGAIGVEPSRIQYRAQRTRWGSCSSRGSLSLNVKLLFLPARLADYVVVHECCHLRHLDHGPLFWSLLEQAMPGARTLDTELREARRYVPELFEV
jgi:predicted metal-dependent hydrolase